MLTFEPDGHIYRWNGEIVSGVTDSLNAVMDKTWMTEAGRERGSAVHALTQAIDEGTYEDWMCPLTLEPYVRAYRAFLADVTPKWDAIEEMVYHGTYCYAGTLDRRGLLFYSAPVPGISPEPIYAIVDIKTGEDHPANSLQLAAYAEAFIASATTLSMATISTPARYVLLLNAMGRYRLHEIKSKHREDFSVFLSLLNLARWRTKNGI